MVSILRYQKVCSCAEHKAAAPEQCCWRLVAHPQCSWRLLDTSSAWLLAQSHYLQRTKRRPVLQKDTGNSPPTPSTLRPAPAAGAAFTDAVIEQTMNVRVHSILAAYRIKAWVDANGFKISFGTIGTERYLRLCPQSNERNAGTAAQIVLGREPRPRVFKRLRGARGRKIIRRRCRRASWGEKLIDFSFPEAPRGSPRGSQRRSGEAFWRSF